MRPTPAPPPGGEQLLSSGPDIRVRRPPAIRDVSLTLHDGEIVALFGANGAGKSTALWAAVGVLPTMSGEVLWLGERRPKSLCALARNGLAFVPEGRSVISGLTVLDNLRLGKGGVEGALDYFPELESCCLARPGCSPAGSSGCSPGPRARHSSAGVAGRRGLARPGADHRRPALRRHSAGERRQRHGGAPSSNSPVARCDRGSLVPAPERTDGRRRAGQRRITAGRELLAVSFGDPPEPESAKKEIHQSRRTDWVLPTPACSAARSACHWRPGNECMRSSKSSSESEVVGESRS